MNYIRWSMIFLIISAVLSCVLLPIAYIFRSPIIDFYNTHRASFLNGGGEKCINQLKQKNVSYKALGDIGTNECPILNAVRVTGFANTEISSSFVLSCPTANSVADWLEEIGASNINHMGTLNCRKQRGSRLYSEHSFGTAIDVSEIDGAVLQKDWGQKTEKGDILANAAKAACNHFNNVITPNTNKLHYDHFHFDNGFGFGCAMGEWKTKLLRASKSMAKLFY